MSYFRHASSVAATSRADEGSVALLIVLGIFLFPSVFAAIGQANATVLVIVFPVTGLLVATFMLREVYGFQLD